MVVPSKRKLNSNYTDVLLFCGEQVTYKSSQNKKSAENACEFVIYKPAKS